MSSFTLLAVIGVWILEVRASDDEIVHGWVPEPNGRGTWSILWSCLATIFICTWSALHLDVPKRHGRWYLLFRKLQWMLLAVIAPELILGISANNFFGARNVSQYLVRQGKQEWTLMQM